LLLVAYFYGHRKAQSQAKVFVKALWFERGFLQWQEVCQIELAPKGTASHPCSGPYYPHSRLLFCGIPGLVRKVVLHLKY